MWVMCLLSSIPGQATATHQGQMVDTSTQYMRMDTVHCMHKYIRFGVCHMLLDKNNMKSHSSPYNYCRAYHIHDIL